MVKAIRIQKPGTADQMKLEEVVLGAPKAGEVLVRHTAIGVNFIDIYHRSGAYPLTMPHGIGMEAVGVVEAIGKGVSDFKIGERVGHTGGPPGSYAEKCLYKADRLIKLPKSVPDKIAATLMLKGMTARYLLRQTYKVQKGDFVLVHAAAGGMGLLLCQWAKALGAKVIGTTSSPAKMALAKKNGCAFPINYTKEDFVKKVMLITKGKGVQVVYDGVGKDTFLKSMECLDTRGHLVCFGAASGQPAPFALAALGPKSLFVTRPSLFNYVLTRADLVANAKEVFKAYETGMFKVQKPKEYKLAQAAQAHEDLAGRKTTGPSILIP